MRLAIEGMRRAKWYSSGILFWMYNDCWPALGYSTVDYYGRPKAAWYSCRRAFAPIAAAICEEDSLLSFHVLNDSFRTPTVKGRILKVDTLSGAVETLAECCTAPAPNENALAATIPPPEDNGHTIVFFEIREDETLLDRARWYPKWLSNVEIAPASISVTQHGNTLSMTSMHGLAFGVALDGDFVADDNFFDLLPGETKSVHLAPPFDSPLSSNAIMLYAYNLPTPIAIS